MLFFNSNNSNKGKKYLTNKDQIDLVYAGRAEKFNNWFADEHKNLMFYLKDRKCFDFDSFNECYLKVYDNIMFSGLEIEHYQSYFIRSYFTIMQTSCMKENRYCELLPHIDREDTDTEFYSEIEKGQEELTAKILEYVYLNYKLREFELFKMYLHLKPAVNYKTLSGITKMKQYRIQRIISKIKKDITTNPHFTHRYKEVV